jgi:hypothetical protein
MRAAGPTLIAFGVLVGLLCLLQLGIQANACEANCDVPVWLVATCGSTAAASILAGVWLIRRR